MRAMFNQQQVLPGKQSRRLFGLALGLALMSAPCWADNFSINRVDFATNGDRTEIILHTGSIVPVEKVQISENKLILDIDQVNTDETVRTNFEGAANISHVILQPLNSHKIRMIIRGESLGKPSVAFHTSSGTFGAENPNYKASGNGLNEAVGEGLKNIQNQGTQPAIFGFGRQNQLANAEKPAVDVLPSDEPVGMTAIESGDKNAAGKVSDEDVITPLSITEPATAPENTDFFKQLTDGKFGTYLPIGLLILVLGGLGLFVRHKFSQLHQREPQLEDLLEEQAQGKRVSFRELADAYRSKSDRGERLGQDITDEEPLPRRTSAEDLIGLRSLKQSKPAPQAPVRRPQAPQPAAVSPEAEAKANAKALEHLISSMQTASQPKSPTRTSAPKKQVLNQYGKQETAQTRLQNKPKSREAAEQRMAQETLQRELEQARRNQSVVQQDVVKRAPKPGISSPANPINRAAAAQKKVQAPSFPSAKAPIGQPSMGAQGPLPGNPEVLNFLRNVADLMEKDGKPDIARSIHKNLSTQSLGNI